MLNRLKDTGSFIGEQMAAGAEIPAKLERDCLLVYEGKFQSLDGEVEVDAEKLATIVENHNGLMKRLAEKVGMKKYPPIQLDHSTSAKDTVGRVVGDLKLGDYTTETGDTVKAVYGKAQILGRENVEKVMDGRWTHLSIGADFAAGKLSELTITPFPAAQDASLLKKSEAVDEKHLGQNEKIQYKGWTIELVPSGDPGLWDAIVAKEVFQGKKEDVLAKAKAWVDAHGDQLSSSKTEQEGEQMDIKKMKEHVAMYEKCKSYMMDTEKLTEEQADEKLGAMTPEDMLKLAEVAEGKLAEKDKEEKAEMSRLSKGFQAAQTSARLAVKKSQYAVRLSKLKAAGKLTPAEIKKIDLAELAKGPDSEAEAFFKALDLSEPKILAGLIGSAHSLDVSKVSKKMELSRLEAESRANMSMVRKPAKDKLAEGEAETNIHIDTTPHSDVGVESEYEAMCKMMDEGKIAEAKEAMKKLVDRMKKMGGVADESVSMEAEKEMTALADEVKKMQTTFEQLTKLAKISVEAE